MAAASLEVIIETDTAGLERLPERLERADEQLRRKGLPGIMDAHVAFMCEISGRGRRLTAKVRAIVTRKPEQFRGLSTCMAVHAVEEFFE